MINLQLEIQLLATLVAVTCSLSGVFLVLRGMAMMSDAISHTILLGIVLGFFLVKDLSSPVLIIGAALMGVVTVYLVEKIYETGLVREDVAIGLVFPFLFSIGIILISRYAGNVHLDIDAVILGEIAFAPLNRLQLLGIDLGPKAIYVMGVILFFNICYLSLFYKELKLVTFDPQLAFVLGFSPTIIHYSMMTMVSVTAVGAFDAVGSILVVALMVGPPNIAYLLVNDLKLLIVLSSGVGIGSSIVGYWLAYLFDVSIGGSIAAVIGLIFFITFLFTELSTRKLRS